jgi:2-methylisoborneol synthase
VTSPTAVEEVPDLQDSNGNGRTERGRRESVRSRLSAPSRPSALAPPSDSAPTDPLADMVAALFSIPARAAPRDLLAPAEERPGGQGDEAAAAAGPVAGGPAGLGTSAARIPRLVTSVGETVAATGQDPTWRLPVGPPRLGGAASGTPAAPSAEKGSGTELYCPPHVRDDEALGETVNDGVVEWAEQVGIYPGRLDRLRAANFGRLIMLTHPGTDDPDRLLAATKCIVAEWATDDHFLDEEDMGADAGVIGSRLAITYTAIDPADLPAKYAPQLDQALANEPVAVAYRSAFDHLARYATATQLARLRHELCGMFMAYNHEANWRTTGRVPPVWEYLTHRHENSFLPPMVLVDPVAGYELPAFEFADRRVRRVFCLAGTASVILNDVYSMSSESDDDFDLPKLIAAEEKCTPEEAIERTVQVHNELMHTFEAEAAVLSQLGSVALRRFLADIWAWLGGNREWHSTTARYRDG